MAAADSIAATDAKAQHEPQWPWSLTGDTTPFFLQSTDLGRAETSMLELYSEFLNKELLMLAAVLMDLEKPRVFLSSSSLKSVN